MRHFRFYDACIYTYICCTLHVHTYISLPGDVNSLYSQTSNIVYIAVITGCSDSYKNTDYQCIHTCKEGYIYMYGVNTKVAYYTVFKFYPLGVF